jgi:hypothetical protein
MRNYLLKPNVAARKVSNISDYCLPIVPLFSLTILRSQRMEAQQGIYLHQIVPDGSSNT